MNSPKPHILVTDDERAIRNTLQEILEFEGYQVSTAESGSQALELISKTNFDLMFLDIKMKGIDGIETLKQIKTSGFDFPVIMISGHGTIEIAVEATKIGAFDFIEKPPDLNRLLVSVRNALSQNSLSKEIKVIKKKLPKISEIIGESKTILKTKAIIDKVAVSNARILITGDNGTGKELIAQWIHEKSDRSSGPFIPVNCAAIPSELLESELFGHVKGAFTGAVSDRIGKFELAEDGTLFLDEIGDMPFEAQAKVLRALQENRITRVGGSKSIPLNVRVLSATNKNLKDEIKEGHFREDLYHRLNVIPIHSPSLNERKEDIPRLINSYLQDLKERDITFSGITFSAEAIKEMKRRHWSGNVRELHNAVERLGILSGNDIIQKEDVDSILSSNSSHKVEMEGFIGGLDDFQSFKEQTERMFLIQKLEENDWNISQTADRVGLQRSHIYTKMKKYSIER